MATALTAAPDATLALFLPQMVLIAFAALTPALDLLTPPAGKRLLAAWAATGLAAALALLLLDTGRPPLVLFGGSVVLDAFYRFFAAVFLLVALLVALASASLIRPHEPHQGEYYALLLLSTLGMTVAAFAGDFLILFLGLELSTLASFALVAYRKRDRRSTEAGMKFFIVGALSSAILLYGISLLYGATGTIAFRPIADAVQPGGAPTPMLVAAAVLLAAGVGFKVSAVPFHMWVPDTYQGAPTPVTAFLAAASKKLGLVAALLVFAVALAPLQPLAPLVVGGLAVATMTVGNVAALLQASVKRMLAYSSVAHAGYMLIAVAVATPTAVAGGAYYALAHALMKGGAFLAVAAVAATATRGSERLEDYAGLSRRQPLLALAMALFLLSLMGMPPLAGFWAKFLVFASAIEAGGALLWLAVAGILNSALSIYYYARVLRYMYVVPPPAPLEAPEAPAPTADGGTPTPPPAGAGLRLGLGLKAALLAMAAGTVAAGIVADPIVAYAGQAAQHLLARA